MTALPSALPSALSSTQPPATPRPLRIVAVARHRLGRVLARLAPEVAAQAQVEWVAHAFGDAVDAVRALHARAPVDAVVAAGASGEWLRQHLDIPVAMVEVRGFDLMRALAAARAISPRVGLVSFDGPSEHLAQLDALFGMGIAQFSYRGPDDAPACVQALLAAGVQAVVAPGLVSDLAEKAGIACVLMYSDDAVRQALDDAIHLARLGRAERARHERLNTVLGQLQDGVVAVDLRQRIEALNPAMAAAAGWVQCQRLSAACSATWSPCSTSAPRCGCARPRPKRCCRSARERWSCGARPSWKPAKSRARCSCAATRP
jgi:propionate catabolism operon transcriptional regulator